MRISHISLFLRSLCSRYLDYIKIPRVALVETLCFELQRDHVKPMPVSYTHLTLPTILRV